MYSERERKMADHDMTRLMQGVIPYLAIEGAQKAIDFYVRAFGAEVLGEPARDESGTLMNASLAINGGVLMVMDTMPNIGAEGEPATDKGLTLQIVTDKGDFWWDRAVAAGCVVTHPFRQEFWGDRYGRVRDPFGLMWAINEPGEGR
jgi:PhnB protein